MYIDNYQAYYRQLAEESTLRKAQNKFISLGFTSDLDVFIHWDEEKFNQILSSAESCVRLDPKDDLMAAIASLFTTIADYALRGLGGEARFSHPGVEQYILDHFTYDFGLGGTAAQAAAALGALNIPVILSVTDRSQPVIQLLNNPSISGILKSELVPIGSLASAASPVLHFIFQYPKGAMIRANGKSQTVPLSNRMIVHNDETLKNVFLDCDFLQWSERHAEALACCSVSGLNAIVDVQIVNNRLRTLVPHYSAIKTANPACLIYFESAHYLNAQVKAAVFNQFAKVVDIFGINEEELIDIASDFGIRTDIDDPDSILRSLRAVADSYTIPGIVLHTKDYSLYYGENLPRIDLEKGLTLGNLLSGTRALTGKYGSYEDCSRILDYALSERGVNFANQLPEADQDRILKLVPSRYIEKPEFTIGLGDTFMAGMLLALMPHDSSAPAN